MIIDRISKSYWCSISKFLKRSWLAFLKNFTISFHFAKLLEICTELLTKHVSVRWFWNITERWTAAWCFLRVFSPENIRLMISIFENAWSLQNIFYSCSFDFSWLFLHKLCLLNWGSLDENISEFFDWFFWGIERSLGSDVLIILTKNLAFHGNLALTLNFFLLIPLMDFSFLLEGFLDVFGVGGSTGFIFFRFLFVVFIEGQ